MSLIPLENLKTLYVHQVHEIFEWFGYETRNKYQILDENKQSIGYAAEQQKGIMGFILRQYFGHWRRFDVHFFTSDRQLAFVGRHPFRWFFQRIELTDPQGRAIGAIQQRFSLIRKRFDVENSSGTVLMEVASPLWRLWTFDFMNQNQKIARVQKQWSGLLMEGFTDRDKFTVEFSVAGLPADYKSLVLAAAIFIDLLYFETKR